ncbi:hypothetical protein [Kribbella sp. NPDC004536]|uniref:hypothetical protein n=1 Tax=Kribbella sp. NPDC004536 TaxID=3364106 RepID=UPI00369BDB02
MEDVQLPVATRFDCSNTNYLLVGEIIQKVTGRTYGEEVQRRLLGASCRGGTYGLGLSWHRTACGVEVYGNDGDALAYQAYSYATEDTRRQVTVAVTPNFRTDPDASVDAFVDQAICR